MAGFPSVLLVLLLALAGCVSVLGQAPAGCPPIKCFRPCPWGYRYFNDCPTCQCRCPRIRCWRPCRWGYIYRNGCRTCQCRSRPWCPLRCYNPICWSVGGVDVRFGPCRNCPPGCRRLFIPQIHTPLAASASSSSDS